MEDRKRIYQVDEKLEENIKEAAKITGVDPDTVIRAICNTYAKQYLEYVKGERNEP